MAKNPQTSLLDPSQITKYTFDGENDALRVVIINPDKVDNTEVNNNIVELIKAMRQKDVPQDRTQEAALIKNIESLANAVVNKPEPTKEEFPVKWIKLIVVVQLLTFITTVIHLFVK